MMRGGWEDLGVVDTIYEEDQEEEEEEEDGSNSLSLTTTPTPAHSCSPSILSPPASLHRRLEEWSRATGCKPDIVIRVHDRCFNLHKDPLISRSAYLRRRLTESSDITVFPPSTVTADIFAELAILCYDSDINLTPSNLAPLRIAAEWLEMDDDVDGNGSLMWRMEVYFRQEIAGNVDNAMHVLRTCIGLLSEAAAGAAALAVRCVEVLASVEGGDDAWMDDVAALSVEQFRLIAESMRTCFAHDHDLLYRIVDYYLENHSNELTEEEKSRICSSVNCTKLSHHLLLHLVQNPRLPLRFVVQAMLVDQLHTRRSFLHLSSSIKQSSSASAAAAGTLTLGAILQRDAVLRQASHLRASMEATAFRIESVERDLNGLRQRLRWSEEKRAEMESARSASFRVVRQHKGEVVDAKSCSRSGRGFGRRLVDGLKSVLQTLPAKAGAGGDGGDRFVGGGEEERRPGHRRNNSSE